MEDVYPHVKRNNLRHSLTTFFADANSQSRRRRHRTEHRSSHTTQIPTAVHTSASGDDIITAAVKLYLIQRRTSMRKIIIELHGWAPAFNAMSRNAVDVFRNGWIQSIQSRIPSKLACNFLYDLDVISISSKDTRELAKNREGVSLNDITHQIGFIRGRAPTYPELSMNTQAPAARYIGLSNERGRHSSSANTHGIYCSAAPNFMPRPTSFGENSKCADIVEHYGMSPIPEGVSHPDMFLFSLRRFKDQSFGRPRKIELTSIYRDFRYHCFSARRFISLSVF
ncbi:hypothetical protein C8R48DRAFT_774985 [Suillus tomentosus]|nr:hypothetical protein C8R48DRAFT_774985 [Suillus tomentosus]